MVSFVVWSTATVVAGALALAALLALLQRLRVQRRRVMFAALPLWSQVARAMPPRVLGGRFRRPLSFLLALAIALALWLAASRPEPVAPPQGGVHVFYLDASALMTGGSAFAQARAVLERQVAGVAPRARSVVLGDGAGTVLLAPGEDAALLPARLAGVRPALRPATGFARWLTGVDTATPATIHYFGHRGPFDATPRPGGALRLSAGFLAAPVAVNRGIIAVGVSPAASGAWDRADVLVTLWDSRGSGTVGGDALRWRMGNAAWVPARVDAAGGGRLIVRDVPATGETLDVALRDGDGFAADDRASIVIPDRRPIGVAIGAGVPASIVRAMRLDPAFRIVPASAAQVAVGSGGTDAGGVPTLVLTDPAREAATFVVAAPAGEGDVALAERLDSLGLRRIDAAGLADAFGRPVTLREATPGAARMVGAWAPLFADRSAFARSPALPLFVSQTLRWLAHPAPWVPYAKAGATLPDQSELYGLSDDPALRADGLGDDVYLSQAGQTTAGGRRIAVALSDPDTSRMAAARTDRAGSVVASSPGGAADLLIPGLLLLAALLLVGEWRLFHRGWMP